MPQAPPPPAACARPASLPFSCRFVACRRSRFFLAHDLVRPAFARRSVTPNGKPYQGLRAGGKPRPTFRDHARDQRLSLALASSCSLSAASLAKGEFGSGALSRRSFGALVANRPPSRGRGGRSDLGLRGGRGGRWGRSAGFASLAAARAGGGAGGGGP